MGVAMGLMVAEGVDGVLDAYRKVLPAIGPDEALHLATTLFREINPHFAPDAAVFEVMCLVLDA